MRDHIRRTVGRRDFVKVSAAATAAAVLEHGHANAETNSPNRLIQRNQRPGMTYRQLGRTNFMSSRLVFGCGAALTGGKATPLLERAYEAGINNFDIGSDVYYRGSEKAFSEFANRHRDDIWITSKAPVRGSFSADPNKEITVKDARTGAKLWLDLLDNSLRHMKIDYVDAYLLMMTDVPSFLQSEEVYEGFLKAKKAGKVGHFGFSSHRRAQASLEAATETGWYDLAMVAISPAGWYDLDSKKPLANSANLKQLRPILERARTAGMGLVGMKAGRYLAADGVPESAYDGYYEPKSLNSGLNAFQRSYAYCLENGLDVVNADMQNFRHFEDNVRAAVESGRHFA